MITNSTNIQNNLLKDKIIRRIFYFLILVVPLIFFTDLTQNPFYIQIILLQITVCMILFFYLLKVNFDKEFKIIKTPLDSPVVFLIAVCVVSVVISILRNKDDRIAIFLMGFDNIVFLILNWVAIFYITVYTLKKREYIRTAINLLFIAGGIASAYGILQYLGMEPIWQEAVDPFGGRCVSTFGNPNFLASFLVLLLPLALVKMLLSEKMSEKIFLFITGSLMFTALICTSTRSAWIGFIASLIIIWIFLIFKVKDKKTILKHFIYLAVIIIVSLVVVFSAPGKRVIGERVLSTLSIQKSGTASSQRFLIWSSAKDMFFDFPIIGSGWGTLELFYPWYQGKYLRSAKYAPLKTHANRAHNEILQFLAETGIIGLGVAVWLLVTLIKYSLRLLKNTSINKESKYIILGLFSGIIGMLIDNLFNVSLHFASPAMVFWINVGIIVSIGYQTENHQENLLKHETISSRGLRISKYVISTVVLVLLFLIVLLSFNRFRAAIHYFNGIRYSKGKKVTLDKAISQFEKSLGFYAFDINTNYELANVYTLQNKIDKAIEYYKKANLVNPGYEEIYHNLGIVYANNGEVKKSIYNFEKALRIGPNSLDTYMYLGKIYIKLEDWTKAQQVYEKITSLNSSLAKAHLHLGNIYFKLENTEKAISEYKKVIQLNPNTQGAYKNLGYVYLSINKKREAQKFFREALRLNPNDKVIIAKLKELEE